MDKYLWTPDQHTHMYVLYILFKIDLDIFAAIITSSCLVISAHLVIIEVWHWCQARRCSVGLRALCRPLEGFPLKPWQTMSSWILFVPQGHCHPGTVFFFFILDNSVLPMYWQRKLKPHICMNWSGVHLLYFWLYSVPGMSMQPHFHSITASLLFVWL